MIESELLLAHAYLNRVVEPGSVAAWRFVSDYDPLEAADRIRRRQAPAAVLAATEARYTSVAPERDLEVAAAMGARLVTPADPEWPHFAFAALEFAAAARVSGRRGSLSESRRGGELVPPLSLWVQGPDELATAATRSIAVVGSRAPTAYGCQIGGELAADLADRDVVVISGGAFGIDATAHRGALAAGGRTWVVSAAGLDRPYPSQHAALFRKAAVDGLVVSEYPPGSAAHRHRFLMRNRLIAALSAGTVVVEAAARSGALNTAAHARALGRQVMAVPGPISSPMSVGCHQLIRGGEDPTQAAMLVTDAAEIMSALESGSSTPRSAQVADIRSELDQLDPLSRRVFDGLPGRGNASEDQIALRSGVAPLDVLRALPLLRLAGLVESSTSGYRLSAQARHRSTARSDQLA